MIVIKVGILIILLILMSAAFTKSSRSENCGSRLNSDTWFLIASILGVTLGVLFETFFPGVITALFKGEL